MKIDMHNFGYKETGVFFLISVHTNMDNDFIGMHIFHPLIAMGSAYNLTWLRCMYAYLSYF